MNDIYIESMIVKNPEKLSVEDVPRKRSTKSFRDTGYINIAITEP
jgi:hypothetical protein